MRTRQHIAAFSLLASVLLGGLIAPLSHFAFMAVADSYGMHGMSHEGHSMGDMAHGVSFTEDQSSVHLECPFAAFFLSQSSAVSSDAPGLVTELHVVSVLESDTEHHVGISRHASSARGPPSVLA